MEEKDLIGKEASYSFTSLRGKILDAWKISNGMTLVKIDCGDSTFTILNLEVVEVKE